MKFDWKDIESEDVKIKVKEETEEIKETFEAINKFMVERDGIMNPSDAFVFASLFKMMNSYGKIFEALADKLNSMSSDLEAIMEDMSQLAIKED